jgi:hypothetical protein
MKFENVFEKILWATLVAIRFGTGNWDSVRSLDTADEIIRKFRTRLND